MRFVFHCDSGTPPKTKQLIALAMAHVTQCPYCIRGHTKLALQRGLPSPYQCQRRWRQNRRSSYAYTFREFEIYFPRFVDTLIQGGSARSRIQRNFAAPRQAS
jgi:AhpD family alkylhydroperoxidase